jgi:deoxyhypusine synthase
MKSGDLAAVRRFMEEHFRHFNAAATVDAARGWAELSARGDAMMVTLAGAMSTAELGRSLAQMIRAGKVQAITCTGANLEEDLFNLVAHHHYVRLPNYRDLTPQDEADLLARKLNRVTDTCIPEDEAMRVVEGAVLKGWQAAEGAGVAAFPHQFMYDLLLNKRVEFSPEMDPSDSWLLAAAEADLPIFTPGWEDSTLGNMFVARHLAGDLKGLSAVRGGLEAMAALIDWYRQATLEGRQVGFFQIGGGIAGDFPICVVPLLHQDLDERDQPLWAYFCQISDSTTSYGSYSGAVPNEKITWGKLAPETPRFVIESDATIVAPLVFAWVLAEDG